MCGELYVERIYQRGSNAIHGVEERALQRVDRDAVHYWILSSHFTAANVNSDWYSKCVHEGCILAIERGAE